MLDGQTPRIFTTCFFHSLFLWPVVDYDAEESTTSIFLHYRAIYDKALARSTRG